LISTRVEVYIKASAKAPIAVGISSIRRPVKMSAKFATYGEAKLGYRIREVLLEGWIR
jgi:hypothetical protein